MGTITSKEVEIDVRYGHGFIMIAKLMTIEEYRNQGFARKAMEDICKLADKTDCIILLTPVNDFGASITRLKKFYRSLGFRHRKGLCDLPSSSMMRLPRRKEDLIKVL